MEIEKIISSWKKNDSQLHLDRPIVNKELMSKVNGGGENGRIVTVSAECNKGDSCAWMGAALDSAINVLRLLF